MHEMNPNHPVVIEMREQWHKLCAIMLHRFGRSDAEITAEDIQRFTDDLGPEGAIVCDTRGGRLVLRLVNGEQAKRLAREAGGLPS